ncbi:MAG: class I SAM-dependent methyltransferase family protein [Thermoplasmata archaeon]
MQGDFLDASLSISVDIKKGEAVRRKLANFGLLRDDLKIFLNEGRIFFPVKDDSILTSLKEIDSSVFSCVREFENIEKVPRSYKEIVKIPEGLKEILPTSFDVVGDIAINPLPDELISYREEIGKAILETKKSVKVVVLDHGVKGQMRVRDIEVVAGERRTETVHTEYGIKLKLDISKVYFSPRLATERHRISKLSFEERILDMFAGVGPFSIMLAKYSKPKVIFSIDINPDAIRYLKENIRLNRVEKIVPIEGDAREVVRENKEIGKVDRVIMNLPHSAYEFLDVALDVSKKGTMIHYYEIMDRDNLERRKEEIVEKSLRLGKEVCILNTREVRSYSASEAHFAFDILVK